MRLRRRSFLATLAMMLTAGLVACGGEEMEESSQAESALLRGTVIYRERMALPVNASIDVRLLDVSLQDVPSKVLAQQTLGAAGQSVPIPFELAYDPSQVRDGLSYAVRAEIRSADGSLLWTTDTVHPVLTRGAPSNDVEIRVVRVGG